MKSDNPVKEQLEKRLSEHSEPDKKLFSMIETMEESLSQEGNPQFKLFWEARTFCLDLFKKDIPHPVRAVAWEKYRELTKQARQLKDLFDKESQFTAEQIETAIGRLEEKIQQGRENPEKIAPSINVRIPRPLSDSAEEYEKLLVELQLYYAFASRINELRKELAQAQMRIKRKNGLFERLSKAGDHVFPEKKQLARQIGKRYIQSVDTYANTHFRGSKPDKPLYHFRNDIKQLQAFAKELHLNHQDFSHVRERLGQCWEQLKEWEKEGKEKLQEKSKADQEKGDAFIKRLEELEAAYNDGATSLAEAFDKLGTLSADIRKADLVKQEKERVLKIFSAFNRVVAEAKKEQEQKRKEAEKEKREQRRAKVKELSEKIEEHLALLESTPLDVFIPLADALKEQIAEESLLDELEEMLAKLGDALAVRKDSHAFQTASTAEEYKTVLGDRKERRQQLKNEYESLRKASGGSGLDIDASLRYQQKLKEVKGRLEEIDEGIREVEQAISKRL